MRPLLVLLAFAVLLTACPSAGADARVPDPDAPAGAQWNWLPDEDWVDARWLPFDQQRLLDALGMRYDDFRDDVLRTEAPIAAAARRRGLTVSALATRLLAGRRPTRTRLRELRRRTIKVLTQQHLADHVFTHNFHNSAITRAAPAIFGISSGAYLGTMRTKLVCPLSLGRRYGRSREHVETATLAALRARNRAGVRRGATTARQAAVFDFSARAAVVHWLLSNEDGQPLR
ncbi:MAG TPA: hypothetical protein VF549_18060 [Solirubrobacteraceae bacterium]